MINYNPIELGLLSCQLYVHLALNYLSPFSLRTRQSSREEKSLKSFLDMPVEKWVESSFEVSCPIGPALSRVSSVYTLLKGQLHNRTSESLNGKLCQILQFFPKPRRFLNDTKIALGEHVSLILTCEKLLSL